MKYEYSKRIKLWNNLLKSESQENCIQLLKDIRWGD